MLHFKQIIKMSFLFIIEVILHAFIIIVIGLYALRKYPLHKLAFQLLMYFEVAIIMHFLLIFFPKHTVDSLYHFPRYYQLFCFGHCAHRFALFNLKYFMSKKIEIYVIIFILVGNFSVVTFDTIYIDISGGWFLFNMTINAFAMYKIQNRFTKPTILLYMILIAIVIMYYLLLSNLYIFWYVAYTAFIIMRIESLELEKERTPVVT